MLHKPLTWPDTTLLVVVDLLMAYSKRADLVIDLGRLANQLTHARKARASDERQSVCTVGGSSRTDRLEDRLTDDDVRQLIADFLGGTPKWKLAERYDICLSSVKTLLRTHGVRRSSGNQRAA